MISEQPLLQVKDLRQRFGKNTAVDGISFCIRSGEAFGLVGESGCGKTTTGRCIMGLYEPEEGEVLFHGQRIRGASLPKKLRRRAVPGIQMVFQDPMASLDPRMTLGESIAEGLIIRGVRDRKQIREAVETMLALVGLRPEYAGRYPHEFSGGQRQRIGIARAMIMEPQLLIADEPISALDVSVQAQIINLLSDLRQRLGLTVLLVAHDLGVVQYFCDRVAVMYRGRIVEMADSKELFSHPLHPYTRSLLSAIPLPDPRQERRRVRQLFREETVFHPDDRLTEVSPGHFLLGREEV